MYGISTDQASKTTTALLLLCNISVASLPKINIHWIAVSDLPISRWTNSGIYGTAPFCLSTSTSSINRQKQQRKRTDLVKLWRIHSIPQIITISLCFHPSLWFRFYFCYYWFLSGRIPVWSAVECFCSVRSRVLAVARSLHDWCGLQGECDFPVLAGV